MKPISPERLAQIEKARIRVREAKKQSPGLVYTPKRKFKQAFNDTPNIDNYIAPPTKVKKIKHKAVIRSSFGESIIADWLRKHSIKFHVERKFKDLINPVTGQQLRMDFYLWEKKICIEFDGRQHYKRSKMFDRNGDSLEIRKLRDILKNKYCEAKNIRMLRIKYDQLHLIEKILCQACL